VAMAANMSKVAKKYGKEKRQQVNFDGAIRWAGLVICCPRPVKSII
jgi:hypothetical protein